VKLARARSVPPLTGYLQACAHNGGAAPAVSGPDPFLPWTPQGRGSSTHGSGAAVDR